MQPRSDYKVLEISSSPQKKSGLVSPRKSNWKSARDDDKPSVTYLVGPHTDVDIRQIIIDNTKNVNSVRVVVKDSNDNPVSLIFSFLHLLSNGFIVYFLYILLYISLI